VRNELHAPTLLYRDRPFLSACQPTMPVEPLDSQSLISVWSGRLCNG